MGIKRVVSRTGKVYEYERGHVAMCFSVTTKVGGELKQKMEAMKKKHHISYSGMVLEGLILYFEKYPNE